MADCRHKYKLQKVEGLFPWEEIVWRCEHCQRWCARWKRVFWPEEVKWRLRH